MTQPTDKQIQQAKEYIIKRIQAETTMQKQLDDLLASVARKIAGIAMQYKIFPSQFRFAANPELQKKVDKIISTLCDDIYNDTATLSLYNHDNTDALFTYINRENHGKTLAQRIRIYCNRYKFEIESAIAAGILLKKTTSKIIQSFTSNLSSPYNNPLFREALTKGSSAAIRLKNKGVSYGVGHPTSARNALNTLTRFTIGDAWMMFWGLSAQANGATGFYSFRSSSLPCDTCSEESGKWHPISEYFGLWHINCRCYFIFV